MCDLNVEQASAASTKSWKSGFVASLDRALRGRVRSTRRVRDATGKRESWAEVTAAAHPRHAAIVKEIIQFVNNGTITSKDDASGMCSGVLKLTKH